MQTWNLHQCGKRVKTKIHKVFRANFYICGSHRGNTGRGGGLFVPQFWIGLKYYFSSRTDSSIFASIAPALLDWSNETSWVFPALKSTSHFLRQSTVSHRSDASSEANSSCCHRSEAWSHKEQKVEQKAVSSVWLAISHITSSGRSLMHSRKHVRPRMELSHPKFPSKTTWSHLLLKLRKKK